MKRIIFLIVPTTLVAGLMMTSCKKQNTPPANVSGVVVTTFAGGTGVSTTGAGLVGTFDNPIGVAVDSSGNVYVADSGNNVIRKISSSGVVTTLANSGEVFTYNPGGSEDSPVVSFSGPTGVAVDAAGNVYVADRGNALIRLITPAGVVATLVSRGWIGSDPLLIANPGDDFSSVSGLAVDKLGDVYWTDWLVNEIEYLNVYQGTVSSMAGSKSVVGSANGMGDNASFNNPAGIAIDSAGNVYVADAGNNLIRKINRLNPVTSEDPGVGVATTFAGSGKIGSDIGTGAAASFNNPAGVAVDAAGNVYVADAGNNMIRKISPSGDVTDLAGNGKAGSANGAGFAASFNNPTGVAVDAAGNVYVADAGNNLIRKITQ